MNRYSLLYVNRKRQFLVFLGRQNPRRKSNQEMETLFLLPGFVIVLFFSLILIFLLLLLFLV